MTNLLRILVLISSLFWGYLIFFGSLMAHNFFRFCYGFVKDNDDFIALMPPITKLAIHYYWIPLSIVAVTGLFSIFYSYFSKTENKNTLIMLITLWLHFAVVWIVLFCFFYEGFTGSMCLHHGPEFEMRNFLECGLSLAPSLYHFSKKIGVKTLYQYKLLIA